MSIGKVSESPTIPRKKASSEKFDVAELYKGPLSDDSRNSAGKISLDEKLRKAYFWITNYAIISPFYDIEYSHGANQSYTFGDNKNSVQLPSSQSYSSFILMPLLNLVARRRCLLVGGPGRGKTASAILMGILAGYSMKELKRSIQHGQPQMTVSDLLGNPLPSDLMKAESMDDIKIAWRKWLGMRVKIIDEYNRIPTRTQSALLTVLADNYAEILDQIYDCPEAAWFLTANDDAGGGTYQVIEALRDRIDIVVKALHFNTRFLNDLLRRINEDWKPEENVPSEIIFTEEEINEINRRILEIEIPTPLLRRIEFFASHFELHEYAGEQLEYKTKDTIKLSGIDYNLLSMTETGKDKLKDLGSQTLNGLSVRSLMTSLVFVKAMAYFRGNVEVSFDDIRNIIPFVLHDKLIQNPNSPFFEQGTNVIYRVDKISWIRKLFDISCQEYDRLSMDKDDPLIDLEEEFSRGLEGVSEKEVKKRLLAIERILSKMSKGRKLYGHMFDDIIKLKLPSPEVYKLFTMVTDTKFYPVDGFYKSFLETERERLNREFLSMKQYYPSLRSEEFKEVLFRLNPIINELETETKENITEIANFLYSSSLKFLAKELIGPQSKYPYFSHSWQQLLQAKELYSVSVIDLLSSLGNAVYNLCILNQMDAGNWLQTLQGIAKKHTTKDEILQAGKISAWIVGLPQYRNSALELCLETETSLLEDIFSVKITESYNILKEVFYEMYKDPWLRFELALKGNLKKRDIVLKKAGGFIGYGGKFRGIPTVQSLNSEFIISSGEEDFRLYADIYGTAVFRVKMEELLSEPWQETEEPGHFLSPEGTLSMGSVQKRFLELKNVHSIASNPHTLLACNRYSYYVFIAGAI